MMYSHINKSKAYLSSLCIITFLLSILPLQKSYASITDNALESDLQAIEETTQVYGERDKLLHYLKLLAKESGISLKEAAHAEVRYLRGEETNPTSSFQDRGAIIQRPLACGRRMGDYFYTNSWTGPANHGHVGIYYDPCEVIEAPGPNQIVHKIYAHKVIVGQETLLRVVNTSQMNRDKAAHQAASYIGRGYNIHFYLHNKDDNGGMNCSQLVWAAYKYGAGIDLDTPLIDDGIVWHGTYAILPKLLHIKHSGDQLCNRVSEFYSGVNHARTYQSQDYSSYEI